MRTILIYISMILFLTSCSADQDQPPTETVPQITLEVIQTISDDEDNEDSWYAYARELQADDEGNVFIQAGQKGVILKYLADGSFDKVIGKKGSGPGEYEDITWFSVSGDSLYVWSRDTQRMIIYDRNGENFRTVQSESNFSYPHFEPVSWGFMGFLNNRSFGGENEQLVHSFDHDLKRIEKRGLYFTDLISPDPEARMTIAAGNVPFHVIMLGDKQAMVSPSLYSGSIFKVEYDLQTGIWTKTDSVSTYQPDELYKVVRQDEPNDFSYFSTGMDGPENLSILSRSLGLYQSEVGHVLNFTYRHKGDARTFGVEVISPDFSYIGFDTLAHDPDWTDDDTISFRSFYDKKGEFYYRMSFDEEKGSQVVEKVRVTIE